MVLSSFIDESSPFDGGFLAAEPRSRFIPEAAYYEVPETRNPPLVRRTIRRLDLLARTKTFHSMHYFY